MFSHAGLNLGEIDNEGIWNSGDAGQRHNMYIGLNGCRYIICRETVLEGILRVCRCCLGEVLYILNCVMFNSLKWSFECKQVYI